MSVVRRRNGPAIAAAVASILAQQGYRHAARAIGDAVAGGARSVARRTMDWMSTPPTPAKTTKRRASTSRGTSNAKRMRVTGKSPANTKGAGFFASGTKSFKKKRMVKIQKKHGINHTAENIGQLEGVDATWVGHCTFPVSQVYRQAVKSIFVQFLNRSNIDVVSDTSQLTAVGVEVAELVIDYRLNPNSANLEEIFVFGTGPGTNGVNLQDLVTWFTAAARPWAAVKDVCFARIYWRGTSSALRAEMVLNTFLLDIEVKSTLKIQNRSVDADGGDSTEDIDCTPLTGKSYEASGTYLKLRKQFLNNTASPKNVSGDIFTGTIVALDDDNAFKEPPQGYVEFTNCKAVGKAYLDPGQIKTSVLKDRFKMYFSTLHQMLVPQIALPTPPVFNTNARERMMGHLRVFCFEKVMGVGTTPIGIAFEHNYEISVNGKSKRSFGVVKSFEKVAYV